MAIRETRENSATNVTSQTAKQREREREREKGQVVAGRLCGRLSVDLFVCFWEHLFWSEPA